MRIGFVYDALYPYTVGGGEKRYWEIASRLSGDHEVHMVSWTHWDGPSTVQRDGIWYHGIGRPPRLYTDGGRRSIREAVEFGVRSIRLARMAHVDVLEVCAFPYFHALPVRVIAGLRREPVVMTWHEYWGDYWREYLSHGAAAAQLVERSIVPLADACIAVSKHTAGRLREGGRSTPPITVVPNGIDFAALSSIECATKDWDAIYVGRLIAHKRVDLLLRAIRELQRRSNSFRCSIVGTGPDARRLQHLAAELELGSAVQFAGAVGERDMYERIRRSKVLVMPSEREGFGMTVLEAAACGVPAVVVRGPHTAADELVRDGSTGLVVDADVDELATAIASIVEHAELGLEMGERARSAAEQYDWERVAQQSLAVYERAVRH